MFDGPQPTRGGDGDMDALLEDRSTNVLVGIVGAAALIALGVYLIVFRDLPFVAAESVRYHEKHSLGSGILAVGAGIFLHFRVFWQLRRPDVWYSTLGQIVGLLGIIGGAVVIVLRFFRVI